MPTFHSPHTLTGPLLRTLLLRSITRQPSTTRLFSCLVLAVAAHISPINTGPIGVSPVHAEPYMALRMGYTCGDCHTNRTGGGQRTVTAEMHAGEILSLPNGGEGILPAHDDWFSPQINEYFSVGADFRLVQEFLFRDEPDPNTNLVENNTALRSLERNDTGLEQGAIYGELRLIPGALSLYIDQQIAPGGSRNREAFVLLDGILPGDAYIKAGRFFPGWGLKPEDDTAFATAASGLNFDRTLSGVEVGRSGLGTNWFLSISEGGENLDQVYTASVYQVWGESGHDGIISGAMTGGSIAYSGASGDDSLAATGFAGVSIGPLALLGQGTWLETEVPDAATPGAEETAWAAYGEANWLIADVVNAKLAFDYLDPDDSVPEDARTRWSIGLEPFVDRFLQVRAFYRVYNAPKDDIAGNRDEFTLEGHLLF